MPAQKMKSLFRSVLAPGVIAIVAMSTSSAHAADPTAWVGGIFGLAVPNADDTTSRAIYGLTGGAKIGSELGVGVYYLTSQKDEDLTGGVKGKFDFDLYGVELAYHFEGEAKGVYLGGRLGTSKVRVGTPLGNVSTSPFHWGLVAGYNHMIGDHFSIGGEANFMSVAEADNIKSFNTLNFLATGKLWF